MNNLEAIRKNLNLSPQAFCSSLGTPQVVATHTYNAIERGNVAPTMNTAKNILALINVNRTEHGLPHLSLNDLCIPGIG